MARYLRWHQPLLAPFERFREVSFRLSTGSVRQNVYEDPGPKIVIFLSGACRVIIEHSEQLSLTTGDILVLKPQTPHQYLPLTGHSEADLHACALALKPNCTNCPDGDNPSLQEFSHLIRELFATTTVLPVKINAEIHSILNQCWYELDHCESAFAMRLHSLLLNLVILLARLRNNVKPVPPTTPAQPSNDFLIQSIREILRKSVRKDLHLGDIADALSISKEHLCRIFKHETGESVMKFLRSTRVEEAKRLLITTNDSIKKISYDLCLGGPSHFCRLFRKTTGMSPSQFRTTHAGGINPPEPHNPRISSKQRRL